jgi:hypothetical protein
MLKKIIFTGIGKEKKKNYCWTYKNKKYWSISIMYRSSKYRGVDF